MQARPRGPGLGGALVFSVAPGWPWKASARSGVRYGPMNAEMLQILIPIVAILAVFGFPVAMLFVWKWFKFKDKELQLDAEMRKTSGQALEARVQRLESVTLAPDSDLRSKPGAARPLRNDLLEAPAMPESSQAAPQLGSPGKSR